MRALAAADTVGRVLPRSSNGALEYADAILPIAPFTETSGTFVNCEGRAQSFNGTVQPFGDARPGWKVLRVIANALGLQGFEYDTPEAVRAQAIPMDVGARLSNQVDLQPQVVSGVGGIERLPMFRSMRLIPSCAVPSRCRKRATPVRRKPLPMVAR